MLLQAFSTQQRVLGALFMREIQTRWGRRDLGFLWLFVEPLVFAFPVLAMWSAVRAPIEHGLRLIPFLWSGYLGILVFRHVGGQAVHVVRNNGALLYHSIVTPLDIFFARCGLEAIGNLTAVATSFFVLYGIGVLDWPHDPALVIAGFLYTAWWSVAVALIVASLSERTVIIEHIWPPMSYLYMPVSGMIYLAEWLPTKVRDVALTIMPPLHAYEMIRGGLFGSRIQTFYDTPYLTFVLAVLTVIGLWLMRDTRQFLELE